MRALLIGLLAATLTACAADAPPPVVTDSTTVAVDAGAGDAAVTETVAVQDAPGAPATASAPASAPASQAPPGPTTAQCRSRVAPAVVDGDLYEVVAGQTFAFASPAYGDGCFVTTEIKDEFWDDSIMSAYTFRVTNADGTQSATLAFADDAIPESQHRLAAIGFADLDADGIRDILAVSANCEEGYAWIAVGDRWEPAPPHSGKAGLEACTVAEAKAAFRQMFSDPVSP